MLGVPDWKIIVGKRHARWLGHVARMSTDSIARQMLYGYSQGRTQKKSGLRNTLITRGKQVLRGVETDPRIWTHTAQNKSQWDVLCDRWSVSPAVTDVDKKVCPICQQEFTGEGGCRRHITKSHPVRIKDFECPMCNDTFKTKVARTKHMETAHWVGAVRSYEYPLVPGWLASLAGCGWRSVDGAAPFCALL